MPIFSGYDELNCCKVDELPQKRVVLKQDYVLVLGGLLQVWILI